MQKCYNCGKEVSDETLICPECGALVKRYTTPAPRPDEQPEEPERGITEDGYAHMFRDTPNRPRRRTDDRPQDDPYSRAQYGVPQTDYGYDRPQDAGLYPGPQTTGQPLYPERPHGSVWRDETGRVRFGTGLTVWLVLAILTTGYFVFGYGALLLVFRFQDAYFDMLNAVPELSGLAESLQTMLDTLSGYSWLVVVLLITSTIHFASAIWLLAGKRRAALIVFLILTLLSGLALLFGSPVLGVAVLAFAVVTFFWLRKYWQLLR